MAHQMPEKSHDGIGEAKFLPAFPLMTGQMVKAADGVGWFYP